MSKKYSKIGKYVGITSATVLMTLSTYSGTSLAANHTQELSTSEHVQKQEKVKEVIRTIKVDDPYKGMQTITQVVCFAKDKNGWSPQTPNYWPTFILPNYDDFEPDVYQVKATGVKPGDESQTITINYHQYRPIERELLFNRNSTFYLFDENFKMIPPVNAEQVKVGEWYSLPKPPKGYEFVDADALPKKFKAYHPVGNYYHLLARPIQEEKVSSEEKVVERPINFNLPTGIKKVLQRIKFVRDVKTISENLNIKNFGEWQLVEEDNVEIPTIDGYHASLDKLPTISGKSLEEITDPVVVNYIADEKVNKDDSTGQTSGEETGSVKDEAEQEVEEGSQTVTNDDHKEAIDEGEQTESIGTGDGSSQTGDPDLKDQEAQTDEQEEEVDVTDEGNQTEEDHHDAKNKANQAEEDHHDVKSEESQTKDEKKGVTDQGSQTEEIKEKEISVLLPVKAEKHSADKEKVANKDAGSQTDDVERKTEMKDQSSQTDEEILDKNDPEASVKEDVPESLETGLAQERTTNPVKAEGHNDDNSTSPLTDDEVQRTLDKTQADLNDLVKKGAKTDNSQSLPQTGNKVETKTTVAGIILTAIVTFTSMFFLHRQNKN